MNTLKTITLVGITALSFSLSACQKSESSQSQAVDQNTAETVDTLSIGYQKSSLNR